MCIEVVHKIFVQVFSFCSINVHIFVSVKGKKIHITPMKSNSVEEEVYLNTSTDESASNLTSPLEGLDAEIIIS